MAPAAHHPGFRRLRTPLVCTIGYAVATATTWLVYAHPRTGCGWGKGGGRTLAAAFAGGADLLGLVLLALCWAAAASAPSRTGAVRTAAVWAAGLLAVTVAACAAYGVRPPYCG